MASVAAPVHQESFLSEIELLSNPINPPRAEGDVPETLPALYELLTIQKLDAVLFPINPPTLELEPPEIRPVLYELNIEKLFEPTNPPTVSFVVPVMFPELKLL